jgi:hypothetical protein
MAVVLALEKHQLTIRKYLTKIMTYRITTIILLLVKLKTLIYDDRFPEYTSGRVSLNSAWDKPIHLKSFNLFMSKSTRKVINSWSRFNRLISNRNFFSFYFVIFFFKNASLISALLYQYVLILRFKIRSSYIDL